MSNVHEHKIRNIYADIANLDDDVISYLRRKGINPLNDRLVISDEIIQHILRDSKALANKGIPRDELVYAIHNINNCNIYFDDVKNKCTQLAKYIHWRHTDFNKGNIISCYIVKNDSAVLITAAEIEKGEEAIISELKKWIYSRNYRSNIDVRSLKLSRLLSTSIYFHKAKYNFRTIKMYEDVQKKLQELLRLTNKVLPVKAGKAVRDSVRENFRKGG